MTQHEPHPNPVGFYITQEDRQHYVANNDTRALTEERLRFVYASYTDQEIEDFLDVFYEVKAGQLVLVEDADNNIGFKAELS
jgi:hypothetical protein